MREETNNVACAFNVNAPLMPGLATIVYSLETRNFPKPFGFTTSLNVWLQSGEGAQRAQYSLTREYSLTHSMKPLIII